MVHQTSLILVGLKVSLNEPNRSGKNSPHILDSLYNCASNLVFSLMQCVQYPSCTTNVLCSVFFVLCSVFFVLCSVFNVLCSMFNVLDSMFNILSREFKVGCIMSSSSSVNISNYFNGISWMERMIWYL